MTKKAKKTQETVHVDERLIQLAQASWQPTPRQLEQVIHHLSGCEHCQVILRALRAAQQESQQLPDRSASKKYHHHLSLIAQTIREAHDANIVGAYVETIERDGKEEACKRFPILAAHLEVCSWCRDDVDEIQHMIQELARAGFIEPPS